MKKRMWCMTNLHFGSYARDTKAQSNFQDSVDIFISTTSHF